MTYRCQLHYHHDYWICLIRGLRKMGYITGGGRFSMIKVASLLLQIYDWLLITSLNLTVTNRRVSESFYKRLRLPGPPPRSLPDQFPKLQCHWPKCVTANRPRRKFRLSIHVRPHSSAIALYHGCPSFAFHRPEAWLCPEHTHGRAVPPLRSFAQRWGGMTVGVLAKLKCSVREGEVSEGKHRETSRF